MKAIFIAALLMTAVSVSHAASTSISGNDCTYTDDNGVKSPCTPEQRAEALRVAGDAVNLGKSLSGMIDPRLSQPSQPQPQPVVTAPISFGSFNLSAFLASYGIR
jgi:hypothetical protein